MANEPARGTFVSMDTRQALLRRLDEIRVEIGRLGAENFAGRYRLDAAADQVRAALSQLDDGTEITSDWERQAVRTLEETELEVLTVNIDTRKEPGL